MSQHKLIKTIDSPDEFLVSFPTDLKENILKRQELHKLLTDDEGFRKVYMEMCLLKPQIAFNTALWTYDARRIPGERNRPFILRPQQSIVVDRLKSAIENKHDLAVDKSREEGATELICKMFALYWWLCPDSAFLVGSRKEQLVDNSVEYKDGRLIGPHQCLFHKIMYGIVHLPVWANVQMSKKHGFLQNLVNNSMIEGESTNESFGAGNRATGVLVDEVGRIEPDVAQFIIDNISDTSPCCIFNSTHFRWGSGHPYAKLLRSNHIEVVTLGFEDNPEKNYGLYRSPDLDIIEIKDVDYYRNLCPDIFNQIKVNQPFKLSTLDKEVLTCSEEVQEQYEDIRFVADGGEKNFKRDRSVWYDDQEARARSKTGLAQNILRIPQGSADMFFDNATIQRLRSMYMRQPDHVGKIKYDVEKGTVKNIRFIPGSPERGLKWWGKLKNFKPNITHNYIVACDIARGTGASNSVLAVCDVNTYELIGLYANPYIDVSDFAEYAVAVCKWLGNAFLIWEANGPGDTFDKRIWKLGYSRVYKNINERKKPRKRQNIRGWRSSPGENGSKMDMLDHFDSALIESIKTNKNYRYIIVHDKATINELEDYMFMPGRVDANLSSVTMDETGARYAHGDRVIATGLTVLAMNDVRPAILKKKILPPTNSFEHRFRKWEEEQVRGRKTLRKYRFK